MTSAERSSAHRSVAGDRLPPRGPRTLDPCRRCHAIGPCGCYDDLTGDHERDVGPYERDALAGLPMERGGDYSLRVGKRAAGRLLDGVEHNGTPEVKV